MITKIIANPMTLTKITAAKAGKGDDTKGGRINAGTSVSISSIAYL